MQSDIEIAQSARLKPIHAISEALGIPEESLDPRGRHIGKSLRARDYSSPVLAASARVLSCGVQLGLFRADLTARDLYLMIAALGYFYLSNRFTLSAFLGEPLDTPAALAHWEAFIVDAVLRTVKNPAR